MVNKTVKYNIKYLQNCNYNSSSLANECEIPQQNVNIDINIENISAPNRIEYTSISQNNYQYNNKIYYNDTLKVIVSISVADMPSSIVNIGSISINYLNENMEAENIFGSNIPVSNTGQVIFTFKPHYNGYIQIIYNDSSNFFISNEKQSDLIVLDKIPINTYTSVDSPFIEHEKEVKLSCSVMDVYGHNLSYGHVVFLGYHDIPRDSEHPSAGQEVVLGNPVPVINGVAELTYVPEQDINIEYIVGHYNYYKEQYGHNFKYYEAHSSHTQVSMIKEDSLNFSLGVLKDNDIVDTTIFDGFIHLNQGDTIRATTNLIDENNNHINIEDGMELKLHIEGTKHIINKSYSNAKENNVENWMKNNVIFEEYENTLDITNQTLDINNIPAGYYNVYTTFKDKRTKEESKNYYKDYTSNIIYIAVNQPTIIINPQLSYINPIENEHNTYKVQVNDNISANLKAICENAPKGMKGYFIINDIKYIARYDNGIFVPEKKIKINKKGDYYVQFSTEAGYYENQGYYPIQSATPILLKVRDILEPIIEIPQGYVDNEYPGQIKYILSVKNWYDEVGINIQVNIKNKTEGTTIAFFNEEYKGSPIYKEINNLSPGTYQIEATINNNTIMSEQHTINKTTLLGEINDLSGSNIISGLQTNIEYNIKAQKPVLSKSIIQDAKIYAKQNDIIKIFNITSDNIVLNDTKDMLSIYYPILLHKDGTWDINFVQTENPSFNSSIFMLNNNNLNNFPTNIKSFNVKRVQGNIIITKNDDKIIVNINYNGTNNNQILLFNLEISYGNDKVVNVPVLTTKDNYAEIPLEDIHEDFSSITIRQQIFNIKVTLDPYNSELMNEINEADIEDVKTSILNEYNNLYYNNELDDFARQIKEDMLYTALFST